MNYGIDRKASSVSNNSKNSNNSLTKGTQNLTGNPEEDMEAKQILRGTKNTTRLFHQKILYRCMVCFMILTIFISVWNIWEVVL